jgi:effector-binding domain-containing protein
MFNCSEKEIEIEFVKKIDIKKRFEYPAKVLNNQKQFIHIFSQKHKPLYQLKDFIKFKDLDFKKYDYLLSFSKPLLSVSRTTDECDYLSKIPVSIIYDENKDIDNYIYVYKILKKNKYRDICP